MADIFPAELLQSLLDDGRGPDVAPELQSAEKVCLQPLSPLLAERWA